VYADFWLAGDRVCRLKCKRCHRGNRVGCGERSMIYKDPLATCGGQSQRTWPLPTGCGSPWILFVRPGIRLNQCTGQTRRAVTTTRRYDRIMRSTLCPRRKCEKKTEDREVVTRYNHGRDNPRRAFGLRAANGRYLLFISHKSSAQLPNSVKARIVSEGPFVQVVRMALAPCKGPGRSHRVGCLP